MNFKVLSTFFFSRLIDSTLLICFCLGACEMVMLGEDLPKQLKANGVLDCYPGMEESDEEDIDAMAESYDIQMGKLLERILNETGTLATPEIFHTRYKSFYDF